MNAYASPKHTPKHKPRDGKPGQPPHASAPQAGTVYASPFVINVSSEADVLASKLSRVDGGAAEYR